MTNGNANANENTLDTALHAVASRAPAHDAPDGGKIIVVPQGYRVERVEPAMPPRVKQAVTMHDRNSFVAYVSRFGRDATQIFAEPGFLSGGQGKVVAVIDYHAPAMADHGVHTVTYAPRYSEQWQRWHKACTEAMAQAEFAEFIEEVRGDIVEPDAAKLLDIVRVFKASKKVEFDSLAYQPNGDVRLSYDERTQQTGSSGPLPEVMMLGIQVYYRGTGYKVPVLVRYKVGGGTVKFSMKMDRSDLIEDVAFAEVTKAVHDGTGIEPYLGRR